jgi:hypothetical protein
MKIIFLNDFGYNELYRAEGKYQIDENIINLCLKLTGSENINRSVCVIFCSQRNKLNHYIIESCEICESYFFIYSCANYKIDIICNKLNLND